MVTPLRPCLGLGDQRCGRLTRGTRCPDHERARERAKRAARPYTHSERQRRAEVVAEWKATFGDVCPGWQVPPHPATPRSPLGADHPIEVALGASETQSLAVLCAACNARKSNAQRAQARG
jgi:5-methylcytosine-specific restriction protein A